MKSLIAAWLRMLAVAALMFGAFGCEREEGPLEETGEAVEEAGEDVGEAAEDAAEETEEAAEDVAD